MPSAITSRSAATVEKITAIHDIKIENIKEKLSHEEASPEKGNFDIQFHEIEGEKEEGNGKSLLEWNIIFYGKSFTLDLYYATMPTLPIIATIHVLKNETKVWTSDTLRPELSEVFSYFTFDLEEVSKRMKEFVDEDGSLTIRLEVNLLTCCLSMIEKRKGYDGLKDTPLTKRAKMEAHSLATFGQNMASMRSRFTDLTITCQGENFQVHRAVLSARSEVSMILMNEKPFT